MPDAGSNANVNVFSSSSQYTFLFYMFEIVLDLLLLGVILYILLQSSLLVRMTSLIYILMVMIHLLFSWIKYHRNFPQLSLGILHLR
jgi:hypothetical protein